MGMGGLYFGIFIFFFVMGGILGDQIFPQIQYIFVYGGAALALMVLVLVKFISSLV